MRPSLVGLIDDVGLYAGCHLQAKGSEAKGRQRSIHNANYPAKTGNIVLDELKAEIDDES